MSMDFNINQYTVTIQQKAIPLLRKEYLLLEYLYINKNNLLTRKALLDAVWPLQMPSDRTVDDHIYRLRKKLKPFEGIKIETVKGYGYRLIIPNHTNHLNTVPEYDQALYQLSAKLIQKYHQYGKGDAIKSLLDADVFGVRLEEKLHATINFLSGNFLATAKDKKFPFAEKAFLYLALYSLIHNDEKETLDYLQRTEKKGYIKGSYLDEVAMVKVYLYIRKNEPYQSKKHLEYLNMVISETNYSFYSNLQLCWLFYLLATKEDFMLIEKKLKILQTFFEKKRFLREYGLYLLLKGFYPIQIEQRAKGVDLINQSLLLLEKTQFPLSLLYTLKIGETLLIFYPDRKAKELIDKKKEGMWLEYRLAEINNLLTKEFNDNL